MARDTLTGSRIRERRVDIGMRQADLARKAGISASYLNLIEHNKRRIGGKLLLELSEILGVEPALLSEGAEATLLAGLREAAARFAAARAEADRTEELAGRFPGWARLVASLMERQNSLEQTVASLNDRMTHDPQLAESVHDILGAVTAIRSSASILADPGDIEPEWQRRFSRNINEDARRLSDSARALATYLGAASDGSARADAAPTSQGENLHLSTTPQEELERFLGRNAHRFEDLEAPGMDPDHVQAQITAILGANSASLVSHSAQSQAHAILTRYARDAARLPAASLSQAMIEHGLTPVSLAQHAQVSIDVVLRRLAALPAASVEPYLDVPAPEGLGLAVCDASGTMTYRKPITGFSPPRFGAACPLWPLYQALSHPVMMFDQQIELSGRDTSTFNAWAWAAPQGLPLLGRIGQIEATMLLIPTGPQTSARSAAPLPMGLGCRVCARADCAARREPAILAGGL